jgi:hypothetical protein
MILANLKCTLRSDFRIGMWAREPIIVLEITGPTPGLFQEEKRIKSKLVSFFRPAGRNTLTSVASNSGEVNILRWQKSVHLSELCSRGVKLVSLVSDARPKRLCTCLYTLSNAAHLKLNFKFSGAAGCFALTGRISMPEVYNNVVT